MCIRDSLTATSGDTGKAALEGFKDVDRIGICVFYPHQKVSQIQYRQMATQQGKNVKVYAIEGNFDDAQSKVKSLFLDEDLRKKAEAQNVILTSANSINIGRLVPQIVYYFESYKYLVNHGAIQLGDPAVSYTHLDVYKRQGHCQWNGQQGKHRSIFNSCLLRSF